MTMKKSGCGCGSLALLWWVILAFTATVTGLIAVVTNRPGMIEGALAVVAGGILITPFMVGVFARRMESGRRRE